MNPPLDRVEWDYTAVAHAYLKRPGYAAGAIDAIARRASLVSGASVADVGAGTGNLTVPLLERGFAVVALEPNDAMRRLGEQRTSGRRRVEWRRALAEATTLQDASCDAVGFGSSFNVVDTAAAVEESARILRPGGSIFCLWNHRCLDDDLQRAIEAVIRGLVPHFDHGARRGDPSSSLLHGSWFAEPLAVEASVLHAVTREDFAEAWRSHLTLRRQAGAVFEDVIAAIEQLLARRAAPIIEVPYVTRAWIARKRRR